MMRPVLLLLTALWATLSGQVVAQDITAQSLSRERAVALLRAWKAESEERVQRLLRVLDDDRASPETRSLALTMVGELRAKNAIPWLLDHIDKLKDTEAQFRQPIGTRQYRCVDVLIAIGKESSRQAVKRLREEDDALRRVLLVDVVAGVEGPLVALLILELERLACQETKDVASARRLEDALRILAAEWGTEGTGYPLLDSSRRWIPREADLNWRERGL